jgi:hypothetical protein
VHCLVHTLSINVAVRHQPFLVVQEQLEMQDTSTSTSTVGQSSSETTESVVNVLVQAATAAYLHDSTGHPSSSFHWQQSPQLLSARSHSDGVDGPESAGLVDGCSVVHGSLIRQRMASSLRHLYTSLHEQQLNDIETLQSMSASTPSGAGLHSTSLQADKSSPNSTCPKLGHAPRAVLAASTAANFSTAAARVTAILQRRNLKVAISCEQDGDKDFCDKEDGGVHAAHVRALHDTKQTVDGRTAQLKCSEQAGWQQRCSPAPTCSGQCGVTASKPSAASQLLPFLHVPLSALHHSSNPVSPLEALPSVHNIMQQMAQTDAADSAVLPSVEAGISGRTEVLDAQAVHTLPAAEKAVHGVRVREDLAMPAMSGAVQQKDVVGQTIEDLVLAPGQVLGSTPEPRISEIQPEPVAVSPPPVASADGAASKVERTEAVEVLPAPATAQPLTRGVDACQLMM